MALQGELNLKTISPKFTEEILYKAVQECYQKKTGKCAAEIVKYSVNYGSGKGDGYLGVLYRIQVHLKQNIIIHLIGKGMPANVTRRKTLRCEMFFANEVYFYNKVVPAFLEFEKQQKGTNYKETLLSIPDCYYAMSDGENDFLVLRDLTEDGYGNADRWTVLATDTVTQMLLMLARFHGISLAMKHVHPDEFNVLAANVTETLFPRVNGLWTNTYLAKIANYYTSAVKSQLENTIYLEKFENFTNPEIFYTKMFYAVESKPIKSVINHGDTWITNFMFRDSEIKAIDFQLMRHGSPILDIAIIVFAITDINIRDSLGGIKGILALYQRELNMVVTSLGAPEDVGITLDELHLAWREFGALGFGFSIELVQLSLLRDEDVEDLDLFDGEQTLTLADIMTFAEIKSDEGKQRLVDLLKFAVDTGAI